MGSYGGGMQRDLDWDGPSGSTVLRQPPGRVRGGLVLLHGAADGRARQPMFDGLARALATTGIAVLSYDRRTVNRGDVPLRAQAADAVAAASALHDELGCRVGVYGFSQGAWAASLAATDPVVDHLVVLGCSGVSPAEQMRFYTDELLRRHGYDGTVRARAAFLRLELEQHLRTAPAARSRREELDGLLGEAAAEDWFEHAYLPSAAPPDDATWLDMDFDPAPVFEQVRAPVLALWGADEECVPREASREAWRASGADVTLVDLPGCGHWPVAGSGSPGYAGWDTDELSPDFTTTVVTWIDEQLGDSAP